jgi:hypothetical protein
MNFTVQLYSTRLRQQPALHCRCTKIAGAVPAGAWRRLVHACAHLSHQPNTDHQVLQADPAHTHATAAGAPCYAHTFCHGLHTKTCSGRSRRPFTHLHYTANSGWTPSHACHSLSLDALPTGSTRPDVVRPRQVLQHRQMQRAPPGITQMA